MSFFETDIVFFFSGRVEILADLDVFGEVNLLVQKLIVVRNGLARVVGSVGLDAAGGATLLGRLEEETVLAVIEQFFGDLAVSCLVVLVVEGFDEGVQLHEFDDVVVFQVFGEDGVVVGPALLQH